MFENNAFAQIMERILIIESEFARNLYREFNVGEIKRQNNLASRHGEGKIYKELIITNY